MLYQYDRRPLLSHRKITGSALGVMFGVTCTFIPRVAAVMGFPGFVVAMLIEPFGYLDQSKVFYPAFLIGNGLVYGLIGLLIGTIVERAAYRTTRNVHAVPECPVCGYPTLCYAFDSCTQCGHRFALEFRLRVASYQYNCARCGYDLRGNTTGLCPECGNPISSGTGGFRTPAT